MKVITEIRHMRLERNPLMLGGYMTCMGTCMNGVGTGMVIIRVVRRLIQWARLRGLTAWSAAGVGSIQPRTCVPRSGAAATRTTGTSFLASGSSAPSLTGSSAKKPTAFLLGGMPVPERTE